VLAVERVNDNESEENSASYGLACLGKQAMPKLYPAAFIFIR